ncbi:MAG: hypothetical protein KAH54_09790 [Candidatus Sabulitectum sp.]|nr:hypothetical protein [Candidatus Sabulitectum sp.]
MIMMNLLFAYLISVSGFTPGFQPPSCGIGAETAGGGVRAFSMGGVSAGTADSSMVSGANPAASAWAVNTGFSWGMKARETEDLAWSSASAFPDISVIMPLPLDLHFSASLSNRSRMNREDTIVFDNGSGTIQWTGGSGESYVGVTARVSEQLAFSLGGKCFFGSAMGDAETSPYNPGTVVPVTTTYRDDLSFSPSWGPVFGAFMNTKYLSAGFSIVTDRAGELTVQRHYMGNSTADTTFNYSVPGELTAGVSAHIHPRVLVGVDYFARKKLSLLGSTTEEGSYLASGIEISPSASFRIRGGYRTMNGLWRDGASRISGGVGYILHRGIASMDLGVGYETWGADESETVLFVSIRVSENWLGR